MPSLQPGVSSHLIAHGGGTQVKLASHWIEETELKFYEAASSCRAKNLRRENYKEVRILETERSAQVLGWVLKCTYKRKNYTRPGK